MLDWVLNLGLVLLAFAVGLVLGLAAGLMMMSSKIEWLECKLEVSEDRNEMLTNMMTRYFDGKSTYIDEEV